MVGIEVLTAAHREDLQHRVAGGLLAGGAGGRPGGRALPDPAVRGLA